MGLSTDHNRTLNSAKIISARAEIRETGAIACVTREIAEIVCVGCGRNFRVSSWRAQSAHFCVVCLRGERDWKRGEISSFSISSRRRLMRHLAAVDKNELSKMNFITLTFPDSWGGYRDPVEWKKALKRFEARFRRAFEISGAAFLWRQEVIDRKSGAHVGELYPHFHLLAFGVSFAELRRWVPGAWFEAVGTGDLAHLAAGSQVARVHTRKGLMSYASKGMGQVMGGELAKQIQAFGGSSGRWWGIAIRSNFAHFLSALKEVLLSDSEAVHVIRAFRRLIGAFSRDYRSLTAFIDGGWLLRRLPEIALPGLERWSFRATGRDISEPFLVWAFKAGKLAKYEAGGES